MKLYREYYVNYLQKNIMFQKTANTHRLLNLTGNIFVSSAITIYCLVNHRSLMESLVLICMGYIGYDVIGIAINNVIGKINFVSQTRKLNKKAAEFAVLDAEKRKEELQKLRERIREAELEIIHIPKDFMLTKHSDWFPIMEKNTLLLKKCENIDKTLKAKDVSEEDMVEEIMAERTKKGIEKANESVSNLKNQLKECDLYDEDEVKRFMKELNKLLKDVKSKPAMITGLNKVFHIYLNELGSLVQSYDETKEMRGREQIIDIASEFADYLQQLRKRLRDQGQMQFSVNAALLLDELKKGSEEGNV